MYNHCQYVLCLKLCLRFYSKKVVLAESLVIAQYKNDFDIAIEQLVCLFLFNLNQARQCKNWQGDRVKLEASPRTQYIMMHLYINFH